MIVVPDYHGFRIKIVTQLVDGAWRRRANPPHVDEKPHVEQGTVP